MIVDLAKHEEKYVTIAELAAYWRVSERTLRYHVQKGSLAGTKFGRSIRVMTTDAVKFGKPTEVLESSIGNAPAGDVSGPIASA